MLIFDLTLISEVDSGKYRIQSCLRLKLDVCHVAEPLQANCPPPRFCSSSLILNYRVNPLQGRRVHSVNSKAFNRSLLKYLRGRRSWFFNVSTMRLFFSAAHLLNRWYQCVPVTTHNFCRSQPAGFLSCRTL